MCLGKVGEKCHGQGALGEERKRYAPIKPEKPGFGSIECVCRVTAKENAAEVFGGKRLEALDARARGVDFVLLDGGEQLQAGEHMRTWWCLGKLSDSWALLDQAG